MIFDRTVYIHRPVVTLCGWQDVKIQELTFTSSLANRHAQKLSFKWIPYIKSAKHFKTNPADLKVLFHLCYLLHKTIFSGSSFFKVNRIFCFKRNKNVCVNFYCNINTRYTHFNWLKIIQRSQFVNFAKLNYFPLWNVHKKNNFTDISLFSEIYRLWYFSTYIQLRAILLARGTTALNPFSNVKDTMLGRGSKILHTQIYSK